jgi:hypothetical protein
MSQEFVFRTKSPQLAEQSLKDTVPVPPYPFADLNFVELLQKQKYTFNTHEMKLIEHSIFSLNHIHLFQ